RPPALFPRPPPTPRAPSVAAIPAVRSVDPSSTTTISQSSPRFAAARPSARNVPPRSASSLWAGTMMEIDGMRFTVCGLRFAVVGRRSSPQRRQHVVQGAYEEIAVLAGERHRRADLQDVFERAICTNKDAAIAEG